MFELLEWFEKHSTVVSVIVTIIYTVLTAFIALLMWRANKHMLASIKNTQKIEESRVRPYIIVELASVRSCFVEFIVTNLGQSAAQSLRITSTPEIKPVKASETAIHHGHLPDKIGLFHHEIKYLAPGQKLKALVGHYSGIKNAYPSLEFQINLKYTGVGGPYDETYVISLKPTNDNIQIAEYEVGNELHKIQESIEKIERKISKSITVPTGQTSCQGHQIMG